MSEHQIHFTLITMRKYGGQFFRLLAEAALSADPHNRTRLFEAFPEIIITYGPDSVFYSEEV